MLRPTLSHRRHLAAGTRSCLHLKNLGRHRPSECFRPHRLRVPIVLENPVPLRPRSTTTRRVFQRAPAALRTGPGRRHGQREGVLLRCSLDDGSAFNSYNLMLTNLLLYLANVISHDFFNHFDTSFSPSTRLKMSREKSVSREISPLTYLSISKI